MTTRIVISRRTLVLALAAALGLVDFAVVVFSPPKDPVVAHYLAYLDVFFVIAAAMVILRVAASFEVGAALWRQWLLIGLGVASFAIGDIVWAYNALVLDRLAPSPGLPDVFYIIASVSLAIGVTRAATAFRRVSIQLRAPFLTANALVIVLVVAEYAFVLRGIVSDPALSLAAKALNIYYPLADICLLLGPAVFVVLVVRGLGKGAIGWPWWAVAAGLACMAISDTVFSAMQISDSYLAGSPVDIGWMAGHMLLAIGASIAYDVAHPRVEEAA